MPLFEISPKSPEEHEVYTYAAERALRYCPPNMSEATLKTLFERGPVSQFHNGIESVMRAYYHRGQWDEPEVHARLLDTWIFQHGLLNLVTAYRKSVGTMRDHDGDWKVTKKGELIRIGHTLTGIRDAGIRMKVICTGLRQDGTPVDEGNPDYQPVEITLQQFPGIMNIVNPVTRHFESVNQFIVPVMVSPIDLTEDYRSIPQTGHIVQIPGGRTLLGILNAKN